MEVWPICPVGFCVQLNNAIATFFGRGQNGVGRDETLIKLYAILGRIRLVGLVQGMIKSVHDQTGC